MQYCIARLPKVHTFRSMKRMHTKLGMDFASEASVMFSLATQSNHLQYDTLMYRIPSIAHNCSLQFC